MAALKRGDSSVPTVKLEGLTDLQKRAYLIADNQLALNAGWDLEALKNELIALKEEDFNLDVLGFDAEFLRITDPFVGKTDVDDVPTDITKRVSKGDTWRLGDHLLHCGDATTAEAYQHFSVSDAVWTDPPYNVDYSNILRASSKDGFNRNTNPIKNDALSDKEFASFLNKTFSHVKNLTRKGAALYVTFSDTESINFQLALLSNKFKIKQHLVWLNNNLILGGLDYQPNHEPI